MKIRLCAYCGREIGKTHELQATRDHVIPKSFYVKQPINFLTVPACFPCNQRKAVLDAVFRDVLSFMEFTGETKQGKHFLFGDQSLSSDAAFVGDTGKSIVRGNSLLREIVLRNENVFGKAEKANVLVSLEEVTLKMGEFIEFVCNGLYFNETKSIL